jgi:hypothetical protein
MPFINGRFYINPAYGRAFEQARRADGVWSEQFPEFAEPSAREQDFWSDRSPREAQRQSSDSHWVTIGGHHVLIEKEEGNQKSRNRRNQQRQRAIRNRIAETASKYRGRTDWAYAKQKGNFPPNTNKCNKFVYDVTKEAGAEGRVTGSGGKQRPPLASEWADRNTKITNWRPLEKDETPQPGDVAAYKLRGGRTSFSGHSGIVTSVDPNGFVHGMAAHDDKLIPTTNLIHNEIGP